MTDKQKEYSKYLKSEDWKSRRNDLKDGWGNECACCFNTTNLHLHHLNYECLGKETILDVVLLCKGCHLNIHKGKLKIWFFTKDEFEAYKKIRHIITDKFADYVAIVKK